MKAPKPATKRDARDSPVSHSTYHRYQRVESDHPDDGSLSWVGVALCILSAFAAILGVAAVVVAIGKLIR